MSRLFFSALALFVGIANAGAQTPDAQGEHKLDGKTCTWASYDSGRYVEMAYQGYTGRIELRPDLNEQLGTPYAWSAQRSGEPVVQGSERTPAGALRGLCGAMIRYYILEQEAAAFDPDAAYRALLQVLGKDNESPSR